MAMSESPGTHITVVLDRSGSMSSVRADTIGGFNTFLARQQQVAGTATLTLVQFDHQYEVVYRAVNVRDVAPLTEEMFVPRGQTALYDAVGRAVGDTTELVNGMPADRRPAVVVAILTDGEENASHEIDHRTVHDLIKQRTAAGWEFLFLGANLDVREAAARIGISAGSAVPFVSSPRGTRGAFDVISARVSASRNSSDRGRSGPKKIH
jgi:hypothetical protein